MNEDDKMMFRLAAFILGSVLALHGIFAINRNREGKVLDCAFNGVACKAIEANHRY